MFVARVEQSAPRETGLLPQNMIPVRAISKRARSVLVGCTRAAEAVPSANSPAASVPCDHDGAAATAAIEFVFLWLLSMQAHARGYNNGRETRRIVKTLRGCDAVGVVLSRRRECTLAGFSRSDEQTFKCSKNATEEIHIRSS